MSDLIPDNSFESPFDKWAKQRAHDLKKVAGEVEGGIKYLTDKEAIELYGKLTKEG